MKNKVLKPEIRFKGFTDIWEHRNLGEIYKFQYGEFNNNPSNEGEYPVFGANGIIGKYTNYNAENSVIIGHMGEYAGSVLWGEGKHFVTYNGTISMPKVNNIISKFGYYMLYQKDINKICGGSGLPFLSYEQLNKIEVCLPKNIEEQKLIASYLTNIDNLITIYQSKYDKLVNVKNGLLVNMFPNNGKSVPKIRFKEFTDNWKQHKLDELGVATAGVSIESEFAEDEKYKVISIGSYSESSTYNDQGIRARLSDKTKNRILNKDDLTMILNDKTASGRIIGRVLIIDKSNLYVFNQRTQRIEPYHDKYNSTFLYEMLNAPQIRNKIFKQSQGNTQIYVNWSTIKELEYMIPNLEEQVKLGNMFKQLDKLIALHQCKLEKLKQIKKSLLSKMFT